MNGKLFEKQVFGFNNCFITTDILEEVFININGVKIYLNMNEKFSKLKCCSSTCFLEDLKKNTFNVIAFPYISSIV